MRCVPIAPVAGLRPAHTPRADGFRAGAPSSCTAKLAPLGSLLAAKSKYTRRLRGSLAVRAALPPPLPLPQPPECAAGTLSEVSEVFADVAVSTPLPPPGAAESSAEVFAASSMSDALDGVVGLEVGRRSLTPGQPWVERACHQRLKLKHDEALTLFSIPTCGGRGRTAAPGTNTRPTRPLGTDTWRCLCLRDCSAAAGLKRRAGPPQTAGTWRF
jgi:hypothetical protein